jgi:hypothetical protein
MDTGVITTTEGNSVSKKLEFEGEGATKSYLEHSCTPPPPLSVGSRKCQRNRSLQRKTTTKFWRAPEWSTIGSNEYPTLELSRTLQCCDSERAPRFHAVFCPIHYVHSGDTD